MNCPKCKEKMDFEDGINHWNIRTWFCGECDIEVEEDITGDLIDMAKDRYEDRNLENRL